MLPATTALLLIDAQQAWDHPHWGRRNNPGAEGQMARLLGAFRQAGRPVFHVRHSSGDSHSPLHPGEPGHAFKPELAPREGERVFEKRVHCAFLGTGLEGALRELGIDRLVIVGFTSHWCVSSSARSAGDRGFKVVVPHDACVAFDLEDPFGELMPAETLHRAALTELHGSFASVVSTEDLIGAV